MSTLLQNNSAGSGTDLKSSDSSSSDLLSEWWRPVSEQGTFYSGGKTVTYKDNIVCLGNGDVYVYLPGHRAGGPRHDNHNDETNIVTTSSNTNTKSNQNQIQNQKIKNAKPKQSSWKIESGGDQIYTFAVNPINGDVVTSHKSSLIRHWERIEVSEGTSTSESMPSTSTNTSNSASNGNTNQLPFKYRMKRAFRSQHDDLVSDLDFSSKGHFLVTASLDSTCKCWDFDGGFVTHSLKGHNSMVSMARFVPSTSSKQLLIVSSSEEGEIKVWDLMSNNSNSNSNTANSNTNCIATFNQTHLQKVTDIAFFGYDNDTKLHMRFATAGRDNVMVLWQLSLLDSEKLKFSVKPYKVVAVYESLDGIATVKVDVEIQSSEETQSQKQNQNQSLKSKKKKANNNTKDSNTNVQSNTVKTQSIEYLVCGGESGKIRIYDTTMGKSMGTFESTHAVKGIIKSILSSGYNENVFITGGADHNLIYWNLKGKSKINSNSSSELLSASEVDISLNKLNRYMGNNEEILSCNFIPGTHRFVCAVSDDTVRIVDARDFSVTHSLHGHTQVVVSTCVNKQGTMIATGSKDKTVRLWESSTGTAVCEAKGHSAPVTAICFPNKADDRFITGGGDSLIKLWKIEANSNTDNESEGILPVIAKEELSVTASSDTSSSKSSDINCLVFGPRGDKLFASGGQDKTIRIWSFPDLKTMATLKGHKRSIWSISFHPREKVLLSSSGDGTLRLWNLNDYTPLKQFEGHDGSVLNSCFLPNGMQIMSASADGLIKLWQIRTTECAQTMEEHDGKVWAMSLTSGCKELKDHYGSSDSNANNDDINSEESNTVTNYIVTGGEKLVLWQDFTKEVQLEKQQEDIEVAQQQNQIKALIAVDKFEQALKLCLKLDRPGQMFNILNTVAFQNMESRVLRGEEETYLKSLGKTVDEVRKMQGLEGLQKEDNENKIIEVDMDENDKKDAKESDGDKESEKSDDNESGSDNEEDSTSTKSTSTKAEKDDEKPESESDDDVADAVVVSPTDLPPHIQAMMGGQGSKEATNNSKESDSSNLISDLHQKLDLRSWLRSLNDNELETLIEVLAKWNSNTKTSSMANLILRTMLDTLDIHQIASRVEGFNLLANSLVSYGEKHLNRWSQLLEKTYLIDLMLQSSGLQLSESFNTNGSLASTGEGSGFNTSQKKKSKKNHNVINSAEEKDFVHAKKNESITHEILFGGDSDEVEQIIKTSAVTQDSSGDNLKLKNAPRRGKEEQKLPSLNGAIMNSKKRQADTKKSNAYGKESKQDSAGPKTKKKKKI